jgi:CRISPR-associated protein (TIGR03986 family)
MALQRPLVSARVTKKERAGRAPYNFIPLPGDPWQAWSPPPDSACFGEGLLSGEIDLELKALTDFFVRGMWVVSDFEKLPKEKNSQPEPFQVDGHLRLPGSSLRGMLRTMVEIVTGSPIDQINDTQLFFRSVASVPDPRNLRSFEPQAAAYKTRLLKGQELDVQAGYLYCNDENWQIRPASRDAVTQRQWYRYRTHEVWDRKKVAYEPDGDFAEIRANAQERGFLVCSGPMPGKKKQWIVRSENASASMVLIPKEDVEAYKEGGVTKGIENDLAFTDHTRGVPCFYVEWLDRTKVRHISFGHTPYFRMPYITKPTGAILPAFSRTGRESECDMARAIFGWVPRSADDKGSTRRGRVYIEDAIVKSAPNGLHPAVLRAVLGQPKPTTYQHYLVQESDLLAKSIHWDGDYQLNPKARIRGHKLYWHRPEAPEPKADPSKVEKVGTSFRPAKKGAVFGLKIRFERLYPTELGAVLTALRLPEGCAHRLGMAKPLGFGSFSIKVNAVRMIDRKQRYGSFFDSQGTLTTAATVAPPEFLDSLQNSFASWYLREPNKKLADFWRDPRMAELKAILTWEIPHPPAEWLNMTRYLEFGRADDYNEGRNYNEYNEIGYPSLSRPQLEKRRPLPPATQVLEGSPSIPREARPKFTPAKQARRR